MGPQFAGLVSGAEIYLVGTDDLNNVANSRERKDFSKFLRLEMKTELDSPIEKAELSKDQNSLAVVTERNSLAIVDLQSGDFSYIKSNSH